MVTRLHERSESEAEQMNMPGSLAGKTVPPLCEDHKPVVDYIEHLQLIQSRCPNCNYRAVMGLSTYLEMIGWKIPDHEDILKRPPQ